MESDKSSESPPQESPDKSGHRTAESLVLVTTGDGKGKSTAAFGTLLRAVAQGWPVAVVQFLKSDGWNVGEENVCRQLGVDWFSAGDGFTWESSNLDESQAKASAAWGFAKKLLANNAYRFIILDEISYPMTWGWIEDTDVSSALVNRSTAVSVMLTGRDMAESVINVADTVTEMRNVKHAFDAGIIAKKGLDY